MDTQIVGFVSYVTIRVVSAVYVDVPLSVPLSCLGWAPFGIHLLVDEQVASNAQLYKDFSVGTIVNL